jgi:hypothetical protein
MERKLDVLLVTNRNAPSAELAELLRPRHETRVACGLSAAIHELVLRVPDVILVDLDLRPFRGDALLSIVAREFPCVKRVLFARAGGSGLGREIAHATLTQACTLDDLLALLAEID